MSSKTHRLAVRRGFSLLEVMVVLIIIGFVLGLVGVNVIGQLKGARHDTAVAQIRMIEKNLEAFQLENGRVPTSNEGLQVLLEPSPRTGEPIMTSLPDDPWGNPYEYASPALNGEPYEIISYGADGREGGQGADADIISTELSGEGDDDV
ncbi:MAG: type II secretion system major pseudopilin GspG [Phycisphaeraceae bacterium]